MSTARPKALRAVDGTESEPGRPPARGGARVAGVLDVLVGGLRRTLLQSRALVGLTLVAAGVVWAIARGLHFYGVSPVHLAYDLDQPPWLLLLVSGWLWYRSRRR
jgi:hypothetical protein